MRTLLNIRIYFTLIGVLMFFACDDFTEVELPQTQLTGTEVYEDEVTATAALSNIYARMRENGMISGNIDGLSINMGLYADELDYYGNASLPLNTVYNHSIVPSNEIVFSLWSTSYSQIYAVNALLEGLSNSGAITGEVRSRLMGEALFIRGLLHFYLLNLYGEIPYIITTDYKVNAEVSREPRNIIYNNIIADLVEAKELLPINYPVENRVRANKFTVQALMARVFLYQEEWSLAEIEANEIISNTSLYHLEADLDAVFINTNPSTIWQLHSGLAGNNTLEGRFFIFNQGPPPLVAVSNDLLDSFENDDLRKIHWLNSVTDGTNVWFHAYKYKQNENTGASQEYSIIFRLEEQYLIRAEARANQMNLTGAKEDINIIRSRAGLGNTAANTQQEIFSEILHERNVEFFTENGHRWFDLKRLGLAASVLSPIKPGWQNRDVLFPIPESELILNPNLQPQNPGY